jgi:hypothetical protein
MYKSHKYAPEGVTGGYDKEGTVSNSNIFQSFKFKVFIVFIVFISFVFYKSVSHLASADNKYLGDKKNEKTNMVSSNIPNASNASDNSGNRAKGMDKSSKSQSKPVTNNSVDERQLSNNDKGINISSNWRLASVIQNKKSKEWFIHIINNSGEIKRIAQSNCTHDEFGQYECMIDGEKITKFSGGNKSGIPSIFSASK